MSALEQALADYLQLRRSLGHELAEAAWLLPGFVAYLDARGSSHGDDRGGAGVGPAARHRRRVTTVGPRRMTAVRGFARYLAGIDAGTEVPPLGLMPHRQRWRQPFIYSAADIDTVIEPGPLVDRLAAAGGDLRHPDRAARGQRAADRGGDQARPRRRRLGRGGAADPRVQVRQVPAGAPARPAA